MVLMPRRSMSARTVRRASALEWMSEMMAIMSKGSSSAQRGYFGGVKCRAADRSSPPSRTEYGRWRGRKRQRGREAWNVRKAFVLRGLRLVRGDLAVVVGFGWHGRGRWRPWSCRVSQRLELKMSCGIESMAMPIQKYKTCKRWNEPGHAHELTFSCFHRLPLLSRDRSREWFVAAVNRARAKYRFDL